MTSFNTEPLQPDLLQGFGVSLPSQAGSTEAEDSAVSLPVARVHIDTHVPHLDRLFDYAVPAALDAEAQPGVRVRVKFGGREVTGWLRERVARSDSPTRLVPLHKIVSPLPVVDAEIFELADALADRYAGLVPDVLRLAVPPRVASVEQQYLAPASSVSSSESKDAEGKPEPVGVAEAMTDEVLEAEPEPLQAPDISAFEDYTQGTEFCDDVAAGVAARAVMSVLPSHPEYGWEDLMAVSLVQAAAHGRGALGVVPDLKSLERLETALAQLTPPERYTRLTANDAPTPRYESFLRAKQGLADIVIGTRSAAYAPIKNLGFVACWDDGDSSLIEQRAPYCHARDVLLLRATLTDSAALFMGYAVSSEAARLVRSRWASLLSADRAVVRSFTPRVLPTGDDYQLARDPLAAIARIPHQAFAVAQDALKQGPVLVQVARAGYIPSLSCQRCHMPARCRDCRGPLSLAYGQALPQCGWCGRIAQNWACTDCGERRWRSGAVGALRTAEELGRAFPDVPVISSSGENVRSSIGPEPALVIATPGGEPVAEGGYSAALLLDADRMMQADSLRAPETALRRWFNAAALVRSFAVGGRVVTTASPSPVLEALVRWDPMGYALWEIDERHDIGLPPAVRTAAITGSEKGIETFLASLEIPEDVRVSGPVPLQEPGDYLEPDIDGEIYRAILFFTYARGHDFTRHLRAVKASLSALKKSEPVQVRCDGLDIL